MKQDTSKYWQKMNLNPTGKDISDCSTRSLCYCLKEDYSEIRNKQNALSEILTGKKSDWNSLVIVESMLLIGDWMKILLLKKVPRYKLAEIFKGDVRIFTESYGHVAVIHSGKVIDTWDSTRGRVNTIIVPYKNLKQIRNILQKNSIEHVIVG